VLFHAESPFPEMTELISDMAMAQSDNRHLVRQSADAIVPVKFTNDDFVTGLAVDDGGRYAI
jgi:hypothetical protein